MLMEVKTGPQTLADGAQSPVRGCRSGEMAVSDAHARYQEAVLRGNCYTGAMASAAMGTSLTSTMVTICLYNPQGSGVNLVLLNINGMLTSAPAGLAQDVLAVNIVQNQAAPTSNTLIAHTNCMLGGPAGKGKLFSATTLAANPTFLAALAFVQATGSTSTLPAIDIDIAGRYILPPNTSACIQGLTTAHNGQWAMTWEEVPI